MTENEYSKNIKILYVEDDDETREIFKEALSIKYPNIISARNGLEGWELFQKHNPEIVISDIVMPEMDGVSMAKKIKESSRDHIVILISAYSDYEKLYDAIKIGVNDFLSKPVSFKDVIKKLDFHTNILIQNELYLATKNILEEYKDIVDKTALVSKTDTKGLITFVNDAFCKTSGYAREELLGKKHNIVKHPDMKKEIFEEMWQTITQKNIWKGIIKNRKKDGASYFVDSTIKPIVNIEGEIIEYIALRYDVTDREEYKLVLEEQLDNKESSLQSKLDLIKQYEKAIDISTIYFRTSIHGEITYGNDTFYDFIGKNKSEILGKKACEIFTFHTGISPCCEMQEKEWRDSVNIEVEGQQRNMSLTVVPIFEDGKVSEYINIGYDVTEIFKLKDEVEQTQKEFLLNLGELSERRSRETGKHVQRVALYTEALAKACGLPKNEIEILKIASPMHDAGKIGIPDSILNKPGKLTAEEFELMKTHASIGYEVFKDSNKEILQAAAILAHEHHERWDGSGYPRGLKGEDIHIYGRIVSIADVFDALSHDRVYKKAWEHEQVMEFFQENRGKMFDPQLCDVFFSIMPEILEIKEAYAD